MKIENAFDVPLPPAQAWALLMNVPETAACFPGADAIAATGADTYKGRVTVKLGPLRMVFVGNLHLEQRDDATQTGAVKANWAETKGRGNAITVTRFALQAIAGGSRVSLQSDLHLAGQVAQYGRGVGMISAISAQLIATFAQNLQAKIHAAGTEGANQPPAATEISGLTLLAKALGNRLKH